MSLPFLPLLLLITASLTTSSRVLLYPYDHLAHVNAFCVIGEELKIRGHTVDIIVADRSANLATDRGLNTLVRSQKHNLESSIFEETASGGIWEQYHFVKTLFVTALEHVKELFGDEEMMARLADNNYDIVLVEGTDAGRSQLLLPYKLGVPFIPISVRHFPWDVKIPSLPSVEGLQGLTMLNKDSSFIDRLANTLAWLVFETLIAPPSSFSEVQDSLFAELVPEKENIGFSKLFHKSELFLILLDDKCLDIPRLSAPHYHVIGGLGAKSAKPLSSELSAFMESATHGAIVMSFGSGIKRVPMDMLEQMLGVFKELKQKIIIRHDGDAPSFIPHNVLIQKWLPQNDLLGHPKTKLFITHCGANGQREAVNHGVPMLSLPWMADAHYNARVSVQRGYGLMTDPRDFDIGDFKWKLNEMLTNSTYYEATQKCSKVLHSLPSAKDTAAFWVEHVLHYGSEHLKPYYLDMPAYKFWMLDIIVFISVVVVLMTFAAKMCCVKLCCRSATAKSKRD